MMYKLKSAEAVTYPVVRLTFEDGVQGEIDLTPELSRGPAFEPLKDRVFFDEVRVSSDGSCFGWRLDEAGKEIDFSADAARAEIELAIVKEMARDYRAHRAAAE